MKKIRIFLCTALLVCMSIFSYAQQKSAYRVKVKTMSEGHFKGTLQEIGTNHIQLRINKEQIITLQASEISKIVVRRRLMSFGTSILYGVGIGTALGSTAFLSDFESDIQVFLLAVGTGTGVVAGTIYGLTNPLLTKKRSMEINGDRIVFNSKQSELSKYLPTVVKD